MTTDNSTLIIINGSKILHIPVSIIDNEILDGQELYLSLFEESNDYEFEWNHKLSLQMKIVSDSIPMLEKKVYKCHWACTLDLSKCDCCKHEYNNL